MKVTAIYPYICRTVLQNADDSVRVLQYTLVLLRHYQFEHYQYFAALSTYVVQNGLLWRDR